ncbi:MAG: ATP-binding cassette domain-containing protein [Clostridia bacterium]|nr:ATP-binding cassette domain-containing protein [Clostridia bacterium]
MDLGKSTLAKLISGISKPTKGDIFINDINTKNKKENLSLRKNITIVFQNPENQIIFERVYDDLAFALKNLNYSQEEIDKNIDEALKKVNMSEFKFSSTQALSLGQKQKIVIASALATKSNILILDEPTSMLDPISKKQIYYILDKLKKDGITIIYITHLLEETLFLSDKIILLENRKIEKNISLSEVLKNICILKEFNLSLPTILNLLVSFKENNININLENFTEDEIIKKIISEIKK